MTHYPTTTHGPPSNEPASMFGLRISELQGAADYARRLAEKAEDIEQRALGSRCDDQGDDRPNLGGGSLNDDIQLYTDNIDRQLDRISASLDRLAGELRGVPCVPYEQSSVNDTPVVSSPFRDMKEVEERTQCPASDCDCGLPKGV